MGAAALTAVVLSERPLLAGALVEGLNAGDAPIRAVLGRDGDLGAQAVDVVILDLDAAPEVSAEALRGTASRRTAFYDQFTAGHAQTAFDLGLTGLFALTAPIPRIVAVLLGRQPIGTATEAVGLTRRQLQALGSLTPREVEVLGGMAQGLTVRGLSAALGVTEHTVQTHRRRVLRKLDVGQQSEAVRLAIAAGVLPG
jgi:two-component system, LuxR family, response regulator FixJ